MCVFCSVCIIFHTNPCFLPLDVIFMREEKCELVEYSLVF